MTHIFHYAWYIRMMFSKYFCSLVGRVSIFIFDKYFRPCKQEAQTTKNKLADTYQHICAIKNELLGCKCNIYADFHLMLQLHKADDTISIIHTISWLQYTYKCNVYVYDGMNFHLQMTKLLFIVVSVL